MATVDAIIDPALRCTRIYAATMDSEVVRGRVKFFKAEKGWGGIESGDAPGDVWVHMAVIDMPGFRVLTAGQEVEFQYEAAHQDSWRYRATWVRPIPGEPPGKI